MFHAPPSKDQTICALDCKKAGARKALVNRLFNETVAKILENNDILRDFALEKEDRCPYAGKSTKVNGFTLTPYIDEHGLRLDCDNRSCERNHLNVSFRFSACLEEPTMTLPRALNAAVNKELNTILRERKRHG